MGGTVAETIRRKDGTLHKMARRTGAYNFMFFSEEWVKGQLEEAIDKHVKVFTEMQKDYEENQYSQQFQFNMSPVYGWCNETMPVDYGLVVIDFQTNKIHSCQSYDAPGRYLLSTYNPKEEKAFYQALFEKGNVQFEDYSGQNKKDLQTVFWPGVKFDEVESLFLWAREDIISPDGKVFHSDYFRENQINQITYSDFPFEVIFYQENPQGYLQMLEALVKDGFSFNEEEVKGWNEFIEDYLQDAVHYIETDNDDDDISDEQIESYCADVREKFQTLFTQSNKKSYKP